MRIITTTFQIGLLVLALNVTSTAFAGNPQHDIGSGMHYLSLTKPSPQASTSTATAAQKKDDTPAGYDEKAKAIWKKYKQISSGDLITQTDPAPTSIEVYDANGVITGYTQAQQSRQDMRTLHFKTPDLDKLKAAQSNE